MQQTEYPRTIQFAREICYDAGANPQAVMQNPLGKEIISNWVKGQYSQYEALEDIKKLVMLNKRLRLVGQRPPRPDIPTQKGEVIDVEVLDLDPSLERIYNVALQLLCARVSDSADEAKALKTEMIQAAKNKLNL